MRRSSINDIIKQAKYNVTCHEFGVPCDYDSYSRKQDLSVLLGSEYIRSIEKERFKEECLANRVMTYEEEDFEQYHLMRYHEDIKPWLDYIKDNELPLELYHVEGTTRWHEGDYKYKTEKSTIYRLLDTETKYMVDFEIYEDEYQPEHYSSIKGMVAHVKYIWTQVENQRGYYHVAKTVKRVAGLLFAQDYLRLWGWCYPANEKDVRGKANWRNNYVYGYERDGKKSNVKYPKLLWMYLYQGWIVTGEKDGDAMISYLSNKMYNYYMDSGIDLEDEYRFARNFSYE
tara:strand:+ start:178 stop:1035 length:858 start_codon:yes stop_codon:yes gene_type:complete